MGMCRRWAPDGEGGAERTLEWRRGFDMDVLLTAVLGSIGRRPSVSALAAVDGASGQTLGDDFSCPSSD